MTKKTAAKAEKAPKQPRSATPPALDDRDAATVDHLLAVAGLTVTDEERAYFIRSYPLIKESLTHLRIPEARYAEPALIYRADTRR